MGELNGAVVAKQALIKVSPAPVGPDSLILPLDMTDYSLYNNRVNDCLIVGAGQITRHGGPRDYLMR